MSYNLIQVAFLAEAGYRVLLFDYQGCGLSSGKISLGTIKDNSVDLCHWLNKFIPDGLWVLMGQGVGCYAALCFYGECLKRVEAVVLESPYATVKGWIKSQWGPVVGDVASMFIEEVQPTPAEMIAKVKSKFLVVIPGRCTFLRGAERRKITDVVPVQGKIWTISGKKFLCVFGGEKSMWHDALIAYLDNLAKA